MSKWFKRHMRFWVRTFWGTFLIAIIGLAVAVQLGRAVFPIMHEYREVVEDSISKQLGVKVKIGAIEGVWRGLRPSLALEDLAVLNKETDETIFVIGAVEAEVGLISSLRDWRLAFRQLAFTGLNATLIQERSGRWRIQGMAQSVLPPQDASSQNVSQTPSKKPIIDDPLDIFLFGRRVKLQDTQLTILLRNELEVNIAIPTIQLENDADFHRLYADFQLDGGDQALSLIVEGVGDPRNHRDFISRGHLSLNRFPSGKVLTALGIPADLLLTDTASEAIGTYDSGQVNLDLWFFGTAQRGLSWHGTIDVEGVPLLPPENVHWPNTIGSKFRGKWDSENGWSIALSQTEARWSEFSAPIVNLALHGKLGEPTEIRIDQLDVALWHSIFNRAGFIPAKLKPIFDELKPHGILSQVQLQTRSADLGYFFLRAKVHDGGVHAWSGVPALTNINGTVETSAFDGHVLLDSRDGFVLNFPKVYKQPLQFKEARGDVRWEVNLPEKRVGISSGLLYVARDDVEASGHFNLRLPFQSSPGNEPEMTLVIGVEKGFANLHRLLVPYTVPEELYTWLGQSIKSGELYEGGFIYHGTLLSDSRLARVLQLSARTENAQLQFDPSWPPLDKASGRLLLDDQEFHVTDLHGSMRGVAISEGEVSLQRISIPDPQGGKSPMEQPAIAIQGKIQGDSGATLDLLKNSPVRDILGSEIASWSLRGDLSGDVRLLVPLSAELMSYSQQEIDLTLQDNQLGIPHLSIEFDDIEGRFHYSDQAGVAINSMQGTLWQQPIEVSVRTESNDPSQAAVVAEFSGRVDSESLQKWSRLPELKFLQGQSLAQGSLRVPLGTSDPIHFHVESSMKGVQVDLPKPLGKSKEHQARFLLDVLVTPSLEKFYQLDYQDQERVRGIVQFEGEHLLGVSIAVGGDEPIIRPRKIWLQGDLGAGDAVAWYDTVEKYIRYVDETVVESQAEMLPVMDVPDLVELPREDPFLVRSAMWVGGELFWQSLASGSVRLQDVNLLITEKNDRWAFDLSGPDVAGQVNLWHEERPLDVELEYIHFFHEEQPAPSETGTLASDQPDSPSESSQPPASGLQEINLATLPKANVNVANWSIAGDDMGAVKFELRPVPGGVTALNLFADIDHLHISGSGEEGAELLWLRSSLGDQCYFTGQATTADVANVLQSWEVGPAMTSKQAHFAMQIQWPGAPDAVELSKISGLVALDLQRGRFIRGAEVGENPLVKLIGLLNFDTLVRRLRLDFSDLHPEGLGYEFVKGKLLFKRGEIEIDTPLQVGMPASQLQLVGHVDINRQKIDAGLVATLPVAGNLTVAAALTGGLSMALGVYVVGKLFKPQMDRVSSLRYRVKGSWEDPTVELEKIFDNQALSPQQSKKD